MEKDLKELFEIERGIDHPRKPDHEVEFIDRLYQELPNKKKIASFVFKIAASIVLLMGIGIAYYTSLNNTDISQIDTTVEFRLGQLSPDLKEVENYYSSNIEILLAHIEKNNGNKDVQNRYFNRLSLLQEEYEMLISEIKKDGPNSFIVSALINNLGLQLALLQELNQEITSSKKENHETI